jgi:hypothetical protein
LLKTKKEKNKISKKEDLKKLKDAFPLLHSEGKKKGIEEHLKSCSKSAS